MNEMEPFEKHLKRRPLRQIPAAWRNEILSAAREAPSPRHAEGILPDAFFSALNRRLASLLWPHPAAWAGLAAIWIFIFAVNFSIRDKTPAVGEKASPSSPETIAELRQQQRLFAELIGANEPKDADRPKMFVPGPRSERTEILTA
jgi:hypothetical protein